MSGRRYLALCVPASVLFPLLTSLFQQHDA
jgi:hypothetical protein